MFEAWYRRLGPRYPRLALLAALCGGYATGALATAGTALYIDMSLSEVVRLMAASWILIWLPEFVVAAWIGLRTVAPISSWVSGARDEGGAAHAWEAAAELPSKLLRQPLLYLAALPGMIGWGLYATAVLDLESYAVPIFFAASVLVYLYWVAVRFLGIERHMRPILDDIGRFLSPDVELRPVHVSLRWRLLASLVAVTLITGIAVGGFSAGGSEEIRGLGLALLGSAVAALLVSSWLIGLLSTSITRPISRLRDATRRVGTGDLSVRVPLASTDESGELTQAFNEMVVGLEERQRLHDAFGAFVDPDLAERVLKEGTDLSGEEVEVSILFLDIRGFTTYSEGVSARDAVGRLNELYGRVVPTITDHGGHANKFIGDGLLAVFGAPARLEDHADRAVAAALEIARVVEDSFHGELRVGVGVNSGRVMSGTIGGGGRLDFTVIGDVVNTAARVESATRETEDDVLITDATRSRLTDSREWEARAPIPLKGKEEKVALFAPRTA